MAYIFGPVPSRRLGLSLGVDLVPYKVCSFDCIYCQLGRTTRKTLQRQTFVDTNDVIAELREVLPRAKANYVTLSGSGEPTLSLDMARLIREIKKLTSTPVAVLTNGSLLSRLELQQELLDADLVVPSLDAGSRQVFERINRPCPGLCIDGIVDGLERFSKDYRGKVWVEVMLVKGVNDGEEELERISSALKRVRAEKIQLNTVERPPAEASVGRLSVDEMERAKEHFDERAELIASAGLPGAPEGSILISGEGGQPTSPTVKCRSVLDLLRRRPCAMADVASGLDISMNEASKLIGILVNQGLIDAIRRDDGLTYFGYAHDSERELIPCQDRPNSDA